MALSTHSGGAADKAGLVHEALWGVRGLLFVLDGEATSIRIETPGDDGAEFYLQRGAVREHWQAKRQITGQGTWSFQSLKSVLGFFFEKFRLGERCVFASVSDAPELRMLTENAAAASSLDELKEHFLDETRRKNFDKLRDQLEAISDQETFEFLRAVTIHGGREITLEPEFGYRLSVMFQGPWQATMAVLRDLYVHSAHETFAAPDIEQYMRTRGNVRRRAGGPSAADRVQDLTRVYLSGQRAKLIRGTPIRRVVADDVVAKIRDSATSLDVLITSAAGGGKSACLCQVVEGLQASGIPVLAFRLDRVEPVASSILLGEKLGFAESPALVLSDAFPNQPVVLVIDQLDCVSTSSGRHPDFFDTVAALRNELLGLRSQRQIHLVLACRKFDFEHDHRLKQLTTKNQPPLELGEFSAEEVKAVIQREGGEFTKLTLQQQTMLRLPQNLSLFVDAHLARTENPFSTPKELCDAYWTEKRKAVSAQRTEVGRQWLPAIQRLASSMSARQELSVPASVMDDFPPDFLETMASEGVITWDGKRYGFGHETFFDYCFARTLPNGGRDFVGFLESDTQHLFRRAQLRQVLAFLRDDDATAYLASLNHLLRSNSIRPHLKLLAVDLLAAHPQASDEELSLMMPWIGSEIICRREGKTNPDKVASRIWDRVFASTTLFPVADRLGVISRWLQSGESWLQDTIILYLRWQITQHAERVAEMVEPFVGRAEWRVRLRYLMEGRNLEKSRRFFDLFLRLLEDGTLDDARDRFASNGTFWLMLHPLAEERPAWCAELAGKWLDRKVLLAISDPEPVDGGHLALNDNFGVDDLFKSARGDPKAFLEHVLPSVLRSAKVFLYNEDKEFPRDRLWPLWMRSEHIGMLEAFPSACETAAELLGQTDPTSLRVFIDQLREQRFYTANHLLMALYANKPETNADEAIGLLTVEPQRLNCGYTDSPYWLSRRVIENCSPLCSMEVFQKLEAVVLAFIPPYERSADGFRWRGKTAYNLASSLAQSRLSVAAKMQITEWNEKFKRPDGPPVGIRSFTVGSPIEEDAAKHMTDGQWLRAIAKYDTEERPLRFEHPEQGGALELARMLQKFVEKEPDRFANLTLQLPDTTHPHYFAEVLRGLKTASVPFNLKLAVARRVFGLDQHDCWQATLAVLGSTSTADLPDDAIRYIQRAAINSEPRTELWAGEPPSYGGDILTHGINTVRGNAAETIRDLVLTDAKYLPVFTATIKTLVDDPSLAVRSCVASVLMAVARHDAPLALQWFDGLIDADDRLLGTAYVQRFIHELLRDKLANFTPTIERMLRSAYAKVREAGGTIACLARLYHESADVLSETALAGEQHCRLGACEVAKSNLLHAECRRWCEAALGRLFVDESPEVRRKAAGCFWHLWRSPETPLTDFDNLIQSFLASPAFVDEPTYLLHALEETKHRVPSATLDVCETFIRRCGEAARDIRTSVAGDELTVGKLVFTAYAQLPSHSFQIRALNVIDQMNVEGLNSASTHLAEFER